MSGKRQHIIPRFLQAGFASRRDKNEVFVWQYRNGIAAFECNTRNVGVEKEFYSIGADTAADDAITDAEGAFSSLVATLRAAPTVVNDPEVPSLIAHFEARTRHLRESLIEAGDYLVRGMASFLSDADLAGGYFERRFRTDPELVVKPLARASGASQEWVERFVANAPSHVLQQCIAPLLRFLAERLRSKFPEQLRAAAKAAHLRALKQDVSPQLKTDRFRQLEYATVGFAEGDMILGDSIVLFEVDGIRRYKTFLEGADALLGVYVPLSQSVVLAGAAKRPTSLPADLMTAIARSSFEYFISDRNSSRNDALQRRIGENSAILSKEELDDIMSEVLCE
jgi:Protein of unknown function (DUF4238)